MKDATDNFGVVIAFLIPGFVLLGGLSFSFTQIDQMLSAMSRSESASVGAFLYATLVSMALGMLISGVRWLLIDQFLLKVTRVKIPKRDFSQLKDADTRAAFIFIVDNHYRYYQYYSNTAVALIISWIAFPVYTSQWASAWTNGILLVTIIILIAGARDCFRGYFERSGQILAPTTARKETLLVRKETFR
jgi:hypothetical protein